MRQSLSKFELFGFIGTHGFQMPLVCPKGVGWGIMDIWFQRSPLVIGQLKFYKFTESPSMPPQSCFLPICLNFKRLSAKKWAQSTSDFWSFAIKLVTLMDFSWCILCENAWTTQVYSCQGSILAVSLCCTVEPVLAVTWDKRSPCILRSVGEVPTKFPLRYVHFPPVNKQALCITQSGRFAESQRYYHNVKEVLYDGQYKNRAKATSS